MSLRKIFGPRREEVIADCRKLMMTFVIVLLKKYHPGDEIKVDETAWPYGTFGGGTKLQHVLFKSSAAVQMRSSFFWNVTQRGMVFSYRRFETTYRTHLQATSSQRMVWPLVMEQIGCPETSVTNYQSTLRNIPEDRRAQVSWRFWWEISSKTPPRRPGMKG